MKHFHNLAVFVTTVLPCCHHTIGESLSLSLNFANHLGASHLHNEREFIRSVINQIRDSRFHGLPLFGEINPASIEVTHLAEKVFMAQLASALVSYDDDFV
ncbi:hypothetical protein F5Y08DRAFT_291917 [Xylaria arbuscula]|nr:hypothetical protein F5Y08DRAFT_291917 [Xylaria arbuscula]